MLKRTIIIISLAALCVSMSTSTLATTYMGLPKGSIHRAFVTYKNDTEITIKTGYGECNGDYWEITSETDVNLVSVLPSGEDYVYIYIDDSASTYPTPVIIGDVNEPTWSDAKQGWYYGFDRCIGAVWSPDTGSTIMMFLGNEYNECHAYPYLKNIASELNPTGSWQDTTLDCSDYVPVNATHVRVAIYNVDSDGECSIAVREKDYGGNVYQNSTYIVNNFIFATIALGPSRNIEIWGYDDDDNHLRCRVYGWKISR